MTKTSSVLSLLRQQDYCCCGKDQGKPIIATFCPKHGATVLNAGGTLEYALDDEQAAAHYAATGCTCRKSAGDGIRCKVHHGRRHTPGPWWPDDNGCLAAGSGDTYVTVADFNCGLPDAEREGNRALAIASLEMLDALKAVVEADRLYNQAMEGTKEPTRRRKAIAHAIGAQIIALEKARAAIAKATGE